MKKRDKERKKKKRRKEDICIWTICCSMSPPSIPHKYLRELLCKIGKQTKRVLGQFANSEGFKLSLRISVRQNQCQIFWASHFPYRGNKGSETGKVLFCCHHVLFLGTVGIIWWIQYRHSVSLKISISQTILFPVTCENNL